MRDRDTIDSELRRLAAVRREMRERGDELSSRQFDALLDERLGHPPEVYQTEAVHASKTQVLVDTSRDKPRGIKSYRPKAALRRFGSLAALPLSLVAVAAALMVWFAAHNPRPSAPPAETPPSATAPPSSAQPRPVAPNPPASQGDVADRALMAALKEQGVPVPSREYVVSHGHAVCDFLANQPDFAAAINFVQQSTIWDADQSAQFAAGAIVSYCPQYQSIPGEMQQVPTTLPDLPNIQGDLQKILDDLKGIRDSLPTIPGQ
ncbi:hypothetical protein A5707_13850 [Mycobacterium kyorinense]|uniref:DUF732 domain-containing protein n=1 Tax=Mycobacterium kyorinense TaxID=487514 RepID=A0A1A2ZLZ1_9MYCO|nr:DUF732 domain-containing protein [Mycobacterium kyorinense]OBI51619.1 hypothetical protein A5707_13850 [Mycobacterium kyorinense]